MFVSADNYVGVALLTIVLTVLGYFVHKRRKWTAIIDRIPGPPGNFLLGNSWNFLISREGVSAVAFKMFDPYAGKCPLVRTWAGPVPFVNVFKAEAARAILNSTTQIDKAIFYQFLHSWIGFGLLTSTGSKWQHRRKLITPSFHFRILESFLLVMNEQANILVKVLADKCQAKHSGQLDIYPYISRCTLDIICETAMGQGVNAQLNANSQYLNAVNDLTQVIMARMMRPWLVPQWIYRWSSYGRREKKALKVVHGFTNKIIKMKREKLERRSGETDGVTDDVVGLKRRVALLDMLLEQSMAEEDSSSAGGQPLTDEDIREEVDTFMFEGHDTTSVGISWAFYCIGQHPEIQQKIVKELDDVFGNSDRDATSGDLHKLKYLECVIKEAMRRFPPVPFFGRKLTEDMEICGYEIPRGVTVLVSPHWIHRDPAYFPEPDKFDPDRFLPHNSHNRDPFAYIPFSAGLRNCIGQKFAMMEEKVVISRILREYKVISFEEKDILSNFIAELVLRPIRGIRVTLEPRNK